MLSTEERARYARHLSLAEVGEAGQLRLRESRVLVVGVGGLGSPVALYLAAAGVGRITLVDGDVVDASNLQRQVVHGVSTLGVAKVESARQRLRDLNPHVRVETQATQLTADNASALVEACDLVIDCSDNFATRYLVNDASVAAGKSVVHASILRFEGQLTVFEPFNGPCYRCLFPEAPAPGLVPSCAEDGVLGVLPGMLGTMQANEALKLLLGIGEPLIGRLLVLDALSMRTHELRYAKRPDCPGCGAQRRAAELAPCPLPADIVDQPGDALLVDVREADEYGASHLPGALHIPLSQIAVRASELTGRDVVLYCKSGARARRAWEILRRHGVDRARLLRGGIT
jgi:molybdopterin/thiamine biosynthesis adenylyltransferase/rhodanese-related sulfurtransferase